MAYDSEFDVKSVAVSEESARKMREMLAERGTPLHTIGSASLTLKGKGEALDDQPPSQAASEPMLPGTSTHIITTELYVDSGGHVHVVTFDEHTTPSGTVLEILSDVPIN